MTPTNEDYELVAQWLDGQAIELSPAQKALAEELAADQRVVGAALDAGLPAGVLHRVNARLAGRRQRAGTSWARKFAWGSAAAMAAALVLLVVLPFFHPRVESVVVVPPTKISEKQLSPAEYVAQYLGSDPGPLDSSLADLGDQIAEYHVQVALGESLRYNVSLAGMNEEMTQPPLDELDLPGVETPVVE